jgi:hypothetical protein
MIITSISKALLLMLAILLLFEFLSMCRQSGLRTNYDFRKQAYNSLNWWGGDFDRSEL